MPAKSAPSTLDGHAAEIWEAAYKSAWGAYDPDKHTGSQEEYAAKTAWAAVKSAGYKKGDDGKWVKASHSTMRLALRFAKVRRDETTGLVTFHAQAACTELDTSGTEVLEPELFDDLAFTYRQIMDAAEAGEPLPEYWFGQAQLPILDLTHYSSFLPPDERDQARLGVITNVYRDGRFLHVDGVFDDTPIGRLAAQAVLANVENAIRTSVGFWPDWGNLSIEDGVTHFKGGRGFAVLDHLALTTVPRIPTTSIMANAQEVNAMADQTKSLAEDALEILGEEGAGMVETLDAAAQEEMQRDSMVTLSDDADTDEATTDVPAEEVVTDEAPAEDVVADEAPDADVVVESDAETDEADVGEEVVAPDPDLEPVEAADHGGSPAVDETDNGETGDTDEVPAEEAEDTVVADADTEAEPPVEEVVVEADTEAPAEDVPGDGGLVVEEAADAEPVEEPVVASEAAPADEDLVTEAAVVVEVVDVGPTSFNDALAEIKARQEAYRIEDGFYLLEQVIANIFASPLVVDKATAIAAASAEYQAFVKSDMSVYTDAGTEGEAEDVADVEEVAPEPEAGVGAPPLAPMDVGDDIDPLADLGTSTDVDPGLLSQAGDDPADEEGYVGTPHQLGRAGTFSDALTRISNAPSRTGDQPALRSRQAQQPVAARPPAAELPAAFAGTTEGNESAALAAMVSEIVAQALEPLQREVASLRAQLESGVAPVNETAPPASVPQRRSAVDTQPPVNPARVTTRATTFGEAIQRLADQDVRR